MRLFERDRELREIEALLAAAVSGRGAVLLVEGLPGIGKTALLAAARRLADARRLRMLTAVGGELDQELPFAIVRQLLEPALRTASPTVRAELLGGAAGLARPVFGLGDDGAAEREPTGLGNVMHGLYWLTANLADTAPLLLAVDDVHWADEASMRFLSHLARRIADLPVLLLAAGRPGARLDDFVDRALGGVAPPVLRLGPLSARAVGLLVRDALAADADEEFCDACANASGGNPFLLAEALTSLRADGVRPVAAEAWRVENLRPDTISRAVLARIARRGPNAARFTRALAVLGPGAEPRQVAQLAQLPVDTIAELADGLAREAILTGDRSPRFAHPLIRTAVYTDSSEMLRAADHKRAARILAADGVAAELIIPHLLAAQPDNDSWVVETLAAAAANALGRGAPGTAAGYFKRALAEQPSPERRGPLHASMGRALGMANRPDEAAEALRTAFELAQEPIERGELALQLGGFLLQAGRPEHATQAFELARSAVDGIDCELPMRLHAAFAVASFQALEQPTAWIARLDKLAGSLSGDGEADRMILACLAFGACATGDRPADEVASLARRAEPGPLSGTERWLRVAFAGSALAVADRLPEAFAFFDRGIDAAQGDGDAVGFRLMAVLRSRAAFYAGRLLDAEADGRAALALFQDDGGRELPVAAAVLIDALAEQGKIEQAQAVADECGLEDEDRIKVLVGHFVHLARGRLRLRQRRPREALADLRACGDALDAAGYPNPSFADWRSYAARTHLALGERQAAMDLAAQNLELSRRFAAPRVLGVALRTMGLVEGGAGGLALLEESIEQLRHSAAQLEYGRSLVEYGGALRRAGYRTDAQRHLRAGLDIAARRGARPLVDRANGELVAVGARPRRELLTGPHSLTAGELRIARLAADGATNRDIAQTLFLTRRTVEFHLTNSYRKLNITRRGQLRAALAEPPDRPHEPAG